MRDKMADVVANNFEEMSKYEDYYVFEIMFKQCDCYNTNTSEHLVYGRRKRFSQILGFQQRCCRKKIDEESILRRNIFLSNFLLKWCFFPLVWKGANNKLALKMDQRDKMANVDANNVKVQRKLHL